MNHAPAAGLVEWEAFLERVLACWPGSEHQWIKGIIQSDAFSRAFQGLPDTPIADALRWAANLLDCLMRIQLAIPYRANPEDLLDSIEKMRAERATTINHLREAASALLPLGEPRTADDPREKYWSEFASLAARINEEPFSMSVAQHRGSSFDPNNFKRKGAAKHPERAFSGWMIRELAAHVPKNSPKRYTAIAQLLALVDVNVEATSVATLVRRQA